MKSLFRLVRDVPYAVPSFLLVFLTVMTATLMIVAKLHYNQQLYFESKLSLVSVTPPQEAPSPSQESIDIAMVLFNITLPPGTKYPSFDPYLEDRGVTILQGWGDNFEVKVGPAAFESWGLLGSTLAHEIEVHCRQSFALIRIKDLLRLDGTLMAERDAYLHELRHAERFYLGESEKASIRATMEFYYPRQEDQDGLSARDN